MTAFLQALLITAILGFLALWLWREADARRKARRRAPHAKKK